MLEKLCGREAGLHPILGVQMVRYSFLRGSAREKVARYSSDRMKEHDDQEVNWGGVQ